MPARGYSGQTWALQPRMPIATTRSSSAQFRSANKIVLPITMAAIASGFSPRANSRFIVGKVARVPVRRNGPASGPARQGSTARSRCLRLSGVEHPHARVPRPGPASPSLGDGLNAGYRYLEVKCLGCDTHQTVALDIVRRPMWTPIHDLERYMRCKECCASKVVPSSAATLQRFGQINFRQEPAVNVVAGRAVTIAASRS